MKKLSDKLQLSGSCSNYPSPGDLRRPEETCMKCRPWPMSRASSEDLALGEICHVCSVVLLNEMKMIQTDSNRFKHAIQISRFNEMTFPNIGWFSCGDAACVQILRVLRSQQCGREIKLESVCIVDGPQAQSGLKISEDIWRYLAITDGLPRRGKCQCLAETNRWQSDIRHTTMTKCACRMWGRSLSPSLMVKPEPSRTCQVALYALSLSRISFDHRGISWLWKFGKFAFWTTVTTVHAAVIFACQSAFCCWRMGSRAGSKFKPMFSSLIWGPNHSQSYLTKHTIESSNRMHSFCIYNRSKKNDTGILRRRKRMQPSASHQLHAPRGKIHFPNWMPSSKVRRKLVSLILQTFKRNKQRNIQPHYDIDRIWNSDFLCLPKALTSKPVSMSLPMFLMYLFASNIAQR